MITPEVITRDDSQNLTYFVAELQEGKTYAIFSIFDEEASNGLAATLELVCGSVDEALEALKTAFREAKRMKKKDVPVEESGADVAPAKRKRLKVGS